MIHRVCREWVAVVLLLALTQQLNACGSGTDQGASADGEPVNLVLVVDPQFLSQIGRIDVQVTGPDLPVPATTSVSVSDLQVGQTIPIRIPAPPGEANRTVYVAAFDAGGEKILSGNASGQFQPGQTLEIRLLPTFRVETRKQGTGAGTVTSTPAGIDCGGACVSRFDAGTSVTLTASASPGSVFAGWSGGGCSGTVMCAVTGNATVTAVFNAAASTAVTVTKSGTGGGTVTSSPSGINCGTACSANFPSGSTVRLTAVPSGNATFTGWSGDCSGTGACSLVLNGDRTVNAEFTAAPESVLLLVNKTGNGTVTSNPPGIACGDTCGANFASGSTVTLTASPTGGSTFGGWGGACSGTGSCTVVMNGTQTVTATFTPPSQATLTVVKEGAGAGTVSSAPGGITDCGGTCTANFSVGTTVTLTANATGGSTFAGWGGACSGSGSCVVTMSGNQTVTATFNPPPSTATLTVMKSGAGSGTVSSSPAGISNCADTCTANFTAGSAVTLTANATGGSTFAGWGGACNGTGPCSVVMNGNQTVTATFNPPPSTNALQVNRTGSGNGTVTSAPAGINCGGTCNANFPSGSTVTLTATPAIGSTFSGWSGGCAGADTCTIVMSSDQTVIAQFDGMFDLVTLSVSKSGPGEGTVTSAPSGIACGSTCQSGFMRGTTVTLSAEPDDDSEFDEWSGSGCSGDGPCVVVMNDDQSVNARFEDD